MQLSWAMHQPITMLSPCIWRGSMSRRMRKGYFTIWKRLLLVVIRCDIRCEIMRRGEGGMMEQWSIWSSLQTWDMIIQFKLWMRFTEMEDGQVSKEDFAAALRACTQGCCRCYEKSCYASNIAALYCVQYFKISVISCSLSLLCSSTESSLSANATIAESII